MVTDSEVDDNRQQNFKNVLRFWITLHYYENFGRKRMLPRPSVYNVKSA